MTEHFTAWITTDTSCLDQACADVSILKDELHGEPDDPNAWQSTSEQMFYAVTTVSATDGDQENARTEAVDLMNQAGWRVVTDWQGVTTGYIATVERY